MSYSLAIGNVVINKGKPHDHLLTDLSSHLQQQKVELGKDSL